MELNMTSLLVFSLFFLYGCLVVIHAAIPIISEPSVAKIHYRKADSTVKLKCQASLDHGSVVYMWIRNGKSVPIKSNSLADQQIFYSWNDGNLIITKLNENSFGDYNCIASSDDASSMSQTQTLIPVKYSSFDNRQPKKYQRDEYTYFQIPFDNHGEIVSQSIAYYWYANKRMVQIGMDSGRRFIDKKGNLHFTFLKKDVDGYDATEGYRCGYVGVNDVPTDAHIVLGQIIELRVTEKDEQDIAPALEYSSKDNIGLLGSEAKLECFFSGYDTKTTDHLPTIKWYENQREIKNNTKLMLSQDNRILTIKNLEEKDEKHYFCQAYTTNGQTTKKAVHLNVTSIPIWVEAPQSITKPIGHTAVFHCEARSAIGEIDPAPPVWFINAKKVQKYDDYPQYTFSTDKKNLTVKVESLNDTRCFQCIVTNHIGKLMGEACLKVILPIIISVQPPEEQKIKKGEIVNLTVQATVGKQSNNSLTCEWTFAEEMDIIPFKYFVESDDTLGTSFIDTSKLCQTDYDKIEGVYTCRISYESHSQIITTRIVLKDKNFAPAISPPTRPWWQIGYATVGIFLMIICIVTIIAFIRLKMRKGNNNVDKKETNAEHDAANELEENDVNNVSKGGDEVADLPEEEP